MRLDLGGAHLAAPAGHDLRGTPGQRLLTGAVPVEQVDQPSPALTEHRRDLGERVADPAAAAEQQLGVGVERDARPVELVGVGRQLQQRLGLLVTRQLGVAYPVRPAVADEEVGEAVEPAIEEGPLVDDVGAGPQRRERVGLPLPQHVRGVGAGAVDLGGSATGGGVVRAELGAQAVELDRLVPVTEVGDPLGQRVGGLVGRLDPAELDVEPAQHRVLAPGGSCQVGRAPQHLAACD